MLSNEAIEGELKKRLRYVETPWGKKQSNEWDRLTNFIYDTPEWETVLTIVRKLDASLRNYAVNRWFNFWSAIGIENIFCSLPEVTPAFKNTDKLVDFTIKGIRFDHKTSVYPKSYHRDFSFAVEHPDDLAKWLYANQSKGSRYHLSNRLFLILYARSGRHWRLRAELTAIKDIINQYVAGFNSARLIKLNSNGNTILTDVLWVVKND